MCVNHNVSSRFYNKVNAISDMLSPFNKEVNVFDSIYILMEICSDRVTCKCEQPFLLLLFFAELQPSTKIIIRWFIT